MTGSIHNWEGSKSGFQRQLAGAPATELHQVSKTAQSVTLVKLTGQALPRFAFFAPKTVEDYIVRVIR
jgi:hypothetical protein